MDTIASLSGAVGAAPATHVPQIPVVAAEVPTGPAPVQSGSNSGTGGDAGGNQRQDGRAPELVPRTADSARAAGEISAQDRQGLRPPPREKPSESKQSGGLTEAEQEMVAKLKARDREVRDHEQAHARVGGQYAGQPSYTYQAGPDGQRYAIGGQVSIDVAPIPENPEATINKMIVVKAAALAPAEPSSADRQVAAVADAQRQAAVADLATLRRAERAALSEEDTKMDRRV